MYKMGIGLTSNGRNPRLPELETFNIDYYGNPVIDYSPSRLMNNFNITIGFIFPPPLMEYTVSGDWSSDDDDDDP